MASKRRLRRNQCGTKRRFPDEKAARAAISQAYRKGITKGPVTPYRCKWCGTFHWGHSGYLS